MFTSILDNQAGVLVALALLVVLIAAWQLQLRHLRARHAREMSRFRTEKLLEVDELKSRFFANVSHEFRIPITQMLGTLKRIQETSHDLQIWHDLGVVHKHTLRLLDLVDRFLDLSSLESGHMKLKAAREDVIPFLTGLVESFASYAGHKRITLTFTASRRELPVYIDRDKFQKVIAHILGNACKFTPEGGRVEVAVAQDQDRLSVRVSDTGIGIPHADLPGLFDRPRRADTGRPQPGEESRIGLWLARHLVELHRGSITVESEEGKGSAFTVKLPLGKAHLTPEEIAQPDREGTCEETLMVFPPDLAADLEQEITARKEELPHWLAEGGGPSLLIVEDNWDVRQYIRRDVEPYYHILEAEDGVEGWKVATEQVPDIIISDLMIPKLDGCTLTRMLKEDSRTCHIPVLLLTGRVSTQDRTEGVERWADDHIVKPFEPAELKTRLLRLLEQRRKLHEHFRKHGFGQIESQHIAPADRKLLQNVVGLIIDRMTDATLGVETLAEELDVSRSVLHKKTRALVGEAPCELIRRLRLTAAAKLIEADVGTVSEVAAEVGFTNTSYFTECFEQLYGVTPAQYHHGMVAHN